MCRSKARRLFLIWGMPPACSEWKPLERCRVAWLWASPAELWILGTEVGPMLRQEAARSQHHLAVANAPREQVPHMSKSCCTAHVLRASQVGRVLFCVATSTGIAKSGMQKLSLVRLFCPNVHSSLLGFKRDALSLFSHLRKRKEGEVPLPLHNTFSCSSNGK